MEHELREKLKRLHKVLIDHRDRRKECLLHLEEIEALCEFMELYFLFIYD